MAQTSASMVLDRDPWRALVSAFLEFFIACLLLLSTAISFVTSKLIKFFELPHPCSYLGLQHERSLLCDQHRRLALLNLHVHDACVECLQEIPVSGRIEQSTSRDFPIVGSSTEETCPSCMLKNVKKLSDGDEGSNVQVKNVGSEVEEEIGQEHETSMVWYDKRNAGVLHSVLIRGGPSGDRCVKRKFAKVFVEELKEVPDEQVTRSFKQEEKGSKRDTSSHESEQAKGETGAASTSSEVSVESVKAAFQAERDALGSLYTELEEERNASAIAANEAMAMITRLQEEKAAIQMEAHQYQRMVEEKADYDQEAITLLKEILFKREQEKFVLEKEVELYRKRLLAGDGEEKEPMELILTKPDDVLLLEGSPYHREFDGHKHEERLLDNKGCNLLQDFDLVRTDEDSLHPASRPVGSHEDDVFRPKNPGRDSVDSFESREPFDNENMPPRTQLNSRYSGNTLVDLTTVGNGTNRVVDANLEDLTGHTCSSGLMLGSDMGAESLNKFTGKNNGDVDSLRRSETCTTPDILAYGHNGLGDDSNDDMRTTSMVMRDNFRLAMEEDVRELTSRLQVLEDDRQLLKQIVHSLKAEKQELREIAQHLRELRVAADVRDPEQQEESTLVSQVSLTKKRRMNTGSGQCVPAVQPNERTSGLQQHLVA